MRFHTSPTPLTAPPSSFLLTDQQRDFQQVAQDFAAEAFSPHAARWDAEHHFPVDALRAAAALGFGGMYVADDVGGSGLGRADAAVIFEALAYGDVSVTAYLSIHNMVAGIIDAWGSAAQRQRFLPPLCSMTSFASYCLTEPGCGSDAAHLTTTAKKIKGSSSSNNEDVRYEINGAKAFISGGGVSDVYLVMARTGDGDSGHRGISAFLVEKGTPGLSFGKKEEKLGWNAQPTTAVMFDQVNVPKESLLGEEGDGFKIAMQALDGGRVNIAACSVGGAQFAVDVATDYVSHRRQFGRAISEFQSTQFKIADMVTNVEASRLLIRSAAEALDAKRPTSTLAAAMAKRFATDACFGVANDALQLLGGYGYLKEYPMERVVRDLRVHSILEVGCFFSSFVLLLLLIIITLYCRVRTRL